MGRYHHRGFSEVFGGFGAVDRNRLSQFDCIGLTYIKACLEVVSGNHRILPLETALKGDLNHATFISVQEKFNLRECRRPAPSRRPILSCTIAPTTAGSSSRYPVSS